MKLAKLLWSLGSLLVNVTIIVYIILSSSAPLDPEARHAYLNDHWHVYGAHWKVEFLLMTMIAIGALYFAIHGRKISWTIISIGQVLLLFLYPVMLGGFRNTPFEIAEMANQVAIVIFVFGNLVFFIGLFHLYLSDSLLQRWLRHTAVVLAAITAIVFLITFAGVISWKQAMFMGPIVNVLYLINAYYGLKIKVETSD